MTMHLSFRDGSAQGAVLASWLVKQQRERPQVMRVLDCVASTGEHGFEALQATIVMTQAEAFYWYDRTGLIHAELADRSASRVWEGRLEDIAIVTDGIQITALGYWRTTTDTVYNVVWSDTQVGAWEPLTEADIANSHPKRYEMDTNNRLYIAPRKNETFSSVLLAYLGYRGVMDTSRQFQSITFTYSFTATAAWTAKLDRRDTSWGLTANIWSLVGNAGTQTATVTYTFADTPRFTFSLTHTAASAFHPTDTDSVNLTITGIRIQATQASVIYANEIVNDLISRVYAANGMLSASVALVQPTSTDLKDEAFIDVLPSDVLTDLAARTNWEVGVWEDRRLHFRPRFSAGRTWYVDAVTLELQRSLETLVNSAYTIYQDAAGHELRSALENNTASIARYGLIRRRALMTRTTSAAQTDAELDAYVAEHAEAPPRAAVTFNRVYDNTGVRWPLWWVRAGDTIILRNLSPVLSTAVDRIHTLRLTHTAYDAITDTLTVVPETPLPSVAGMLAEALPDITKWRPGPHERPFPGGPFIPPPGNPGGRW